GQQENPDLHFLFAFHGFIIFISWFRVARTPLRVPDRVRALPRDGSVRSASVRARGLSADRASGLLPCRTGNRSECTGKTRPIREKEDTGKHGLSRSEAN